MKNKSALREFALDTLYDIGGSILYALGVYTFALKGAFAPGGVSGLALICNHFTGWPVGIVSVVLNLPILLVSRKVLNRTFLFKSLRTILISTIMLDLVFPHFAVYEGNRLLAAVFTGVCLGAGLAIIYLRGSSTGGVDFLLYAIRRRAPHMSFGQITLFLDGAVILTGYFACGDIDSVLYGMVAVFASTIVMDRIVYGAGGGKLALIVTSDGSAVARAISDAVNRGATLIPAVGSYSGRSLETVLCACGKAEVARVRTAAHAVDPRAMVMICEASELFGEGFQPPELPDKKPDQRGG